MIDKNKDDQPQQKEARHMTHKVKYTQDMVIPSDPNDWVGRLVHADYLDEKGLHTQAKRQRWFAGFIKHLEENKDNTSSNLASYYDRDRPHEYIGGLPEWAVRLAAVKFAHDTNKTGHLTPDHIKFLHKAERVGLGLEPLQDIHDELVNSKIDPFHPDADDPKLAVQDLFHPHMDLGEHPTVNSIRPGVGDTLVDPFARHEWAAPHYVDGGSSERFYFTGKLKKYANQNPPPTDEAQPPEKYYAKLAKFLR